jgi:hypothetical protein
MLYRTFARSYAVRSFYVHGAFFDKTEMLAEFPQLCNYEGFAL